MAQVYVPRGEYTPTLPTLRVSNMELPPQKPPTFTKEQEQYIADQLAHLKAVAQPPQAPVASSPPPPPSPEKEQPKKPSLAWRSFTFLVKSSLAIGTTVAVYSVVDALFFNCHGFKPLRSYVPQSPFTSSVEDLLGYRTVDEWRKSSTLLCGNVQQLYKDVIQAATPYYTQAKETVTPGLQWVVKTMDPVSAWAQGVLAHITG